jgi:hypothetical protein
MAPHDISRLERQIKTLNSRLKKLAADDELPELLRHIHQPGWTTPAELEFVNSILVSLQAQVESVAALKTNLLEGSRQISAAGVRKAA